MLLPSLNSISTSSTRRGWGQRIVLLCLMAVTLLLSGCASTIRSEVTAFHRWPATLNGQSFRFASPAQTNLERSDYQALLREHLLALGLIEAPADKAADFSVSFEYSISARDVRVVDTVLVDSWYGTPWMGPGYYGPYNAWPGYGHPFYGPMWPSMPVARAREQRYTVFRREFKLHITDSATQTAKYQVTVVSEGREDNLALLMPYLIQSAFTGFPGKSGEPRIIELKQKAITEIPR